MANKKISDFPLGSASGTTLVPVMNNGVTERITLGQITVAKLVNSDKEVTLGSDGVLALPAGGDIVDSDGNSVLASQLAGITTGNLVVGTGGGLNDGNRIYTSNVNGVITLVPDGGAVEIGIPGETGIYLKFQDGTQQNTAFTTNNTLSKVLWVATNGNNATANGSIFKPFATLQAAHDYAGANFSATDHVSLMLTPGVYAGVTLTRPRTHIAGMASMSHATRITESITINPTTAVEGVYNSTFELAELLVTPATGNALVITGGQVLSVLGHRIKLWVGNTNQTALQVNNTAASGVRMEFVDSTFQSTGTTGITCDVSNVFAGTFKNSNVYGGSNTAMKFVNSTLTLSTVGISCSGADAVSITGNSVISAGNCTFGSSAANSNGLNIGTGATAVVGQCAFDVPTGTGYAVKGVAGSVFVYANNIIAYGKNNKISSAMTSVPMGTTFTSAV